MSPQMWGDPIVRRYRTAAHPTEDGPGPCAGAPPGWQAVNWRSFGAPDPDDCLWWRSSGILLSPRTSTDVARFADEDIDAALDPARATEDVDERDAHHQTVVLRLSEGAAYVRLGKPTWVLAALPGIQGLATGQVTMATLGGKTWLADLWLDRG